MTVALPHQVRNLWWVYSGGKTSTQVPSTQGKMFTPSWLFLFYSATLMCPLPNIFPEVKISQSPLPKARWRKHFPKEIY